MADRTPLPEPILEGRVIAVMRGVAHDLVRDIAHLVVSEGIETIEITMDTEGAVEVIGDLAGRGHLVGAGTVRSVDDAATAVSAGASFLVSPVADVPVIEWALARSVPVVPGGLTPTEIATEWDMGVSAVKVFPASLGGPSYIGSLVAPLGGVPMIPTGGIDDTNAASFIEAGAAAVGVGSWLTGSSDLHVIAERAGSLVGALRRQR